MPTFDPRSLGVYVITSGTLRPGRGHRDVAAAAIEGGATAIQLRAPELDGDDLLPLARELALLCRHHGVLFVVNDRPEVAAGLDGVGAHVGQDGDAARVRELLGPDRALGVSVSDPTEAREAAAAGADYLGVSVWATSTKPEAIPRGLGMVRAVSEASGLPVVGIGGIDADTAGDVLEAGASGVAVISAVAAAEDPAGATRRLREVVDAHRRREEGAGP